MALPRSLTQPLRRGNLLVGSGWRGYFAPYNVALAASSGNTSNGPLNVDMQTGPFTDNSIPAGFSDLGWIQDFKFTPGSKLGMVRSGYKGAVRLIYKGEVGESFEFKFKESTRLAWKISTGSQIFNLLVNGGGSASGPLSSSGSSAVPIGVSGYISAGLPQGVNVPAAFANQPVLMVPAGSGAAFPASTYIVADDDYVQGSYGIIGSAGAPVFKGSVTDVDFIRKTSDFVAGVKAVLPGAIAGQDALVLNGPFVGGGNAAVGTPLYGPGPNAKVQKIVGYAAREGGTGFTEWTGLFIMNTLDYSQIALYYPHVAPQQFRELGTWQIEGIGTTDTTGYALDCVMNALAYDDPLDGETVVRYAAFYPAPNIAIQA